MSDAPETIWTTGSKTMGSWNSDMVNPKIAPTQTEYRRADLPPTLSAAMELPEVRALVEALENIYNVADKPVQNDRENGRYIYEWAVIDDALELAHEALATFTEAKP